MPIEIMKLYTREYIKSNPQKIFVFGDNNMRIGFGGQAAEARGELNAIGIRTKKAPTYNKVDFLTDKEFPENAKFIFEDFNNVIRKLEEGKTVVWPADGVGTGIAALPQKAPRTLSFIIMMINFLQKTYGVKYES